MADERTIFDEPHHQSLELLAINALAKGDPTSAFRLADRRCRILPQADPHCFVLRGEASFQLGAKASAIADLATALEIAPDDIAANRRMLAWAQGSQQLGAAAALVALERNFALLQKPVQILRASGRDNFAGVSVLEDTIEGWALWQHDCPLEISVTNDADVVALFIEPDPFHSLGDFGNAANFSVRRPQSLTAQSISLSAAGVLIYASRTGGNGLQPKAVVHRPQPRDNLDRSVTVIVPVYADFEATRECLDGLLAGLKSSSHHAILVDDVTPEPRIKRYLAGLAGRSNVTVLTNGSNLGFAGSVNRALATVSHGDVILLNSDTIVPQRFIDRLAAAAHSSPDIGTVTPLSNNGEFTSFPVPYAANKMGPRDTIKKIDAIAASENTGKVVDIPSGIGFCLYITRACLDSVGTLSDAFASGYLEDADYCLRARDRGFRSVCAPSVYIGHAGSKSFGQKKRSLVVRNLGILERHYPKHRAECAAFMAADPLKAARAAIERAAIEKPTAPTILVTGSGAVLAIAQERARAFADRAEPAMILEIEAGGIQAKLADAAGGIPQSLEFDFGSSSGSAALVDFIRSLRPARIELLDPAAVPHELVDALLGLDTSYDIFIADAGLLGPADAQPLAAAAQTTKAPVPAAKPRIGSDAWIKRWTKIADGARHVLVPCPEAERFARSVLPKRKFERVERPVAKDRPKTTKRRKLDRVQVGLVPLRPGAHEQRLMGAIIQRLTAKRPNVSFTIVGEVLDDMALMRGGNAFVTGPVAAEEFERVIDGHGLHCLFLIASRPLFGHPIEHAARSGSLPIASFDWSPARAKPGKNDLAIDPHCSLAVLVNRLSGWIPGP